MTPSERIVGTINSPILHTLHISLGISKKQIRQLITFANTDQEVVRQTSDPKRFANLEAYEQWRKKGRTVYTLTNEKEDLLGILWIGEESLPDEQFIKSFDQTLYGVTFAIRLYGQARGKGLTQTFMKQAFTDFQTTNPTEHPGIWLETSESNTPAVKSYTKFGFEQAAGADEHGRILMILPQSLNSRESLTT